MILLSVWFVYLVLCAGLALIMERDRRRSSKHPRDSGSKNEHL